MPPDLRGVERTSYYTMKTPGRSQSTSAHSHPHSHAHTKTNPQSPSAFRNTPSTAKSTSSPMASPRMPYSVGQVHPPKLSPSANLISAQDARTPSPNYFGLAVEPLADPRESALLPRDNWSPPSSSVKSFAAAIPKQLPLDANPEFEAFKRQVDVNKGRAAFNLSTTTFGLGAGGASTPSPSALLRPRPPRWHTHGSDSAEPLPRLSGMSNGGFKLEAPPGRVTSDAAESRNIQAPDRMLSNVKRQLETSGGTPSLLDMNQHESPAQVESPFPAPEPRRSNLSKVDDRHPRLSMMEGKATPPSPAPGRPSRAETLPSTPDNTGPAMMSPAQLRDLLETAPESDYLVLDLRVSPQYAQARIRGALNLCIPTTLLKRATFTLQKLQQTFQTEANQERFANWREAKFLIVHDAFSSEKRDAVSALNMMKKFTNEGYTGGTYILRGGFNGFATQYPHLVDHSSGSAKPQLSLGTGTGAASNVPPVIGGVMLPASGNNGANPFFNNIRQNQDLVDGVGQMEVSLPPGINIADLPRWLRDAADRGNHGKNVSDKFLDIELKEQTRMREAYSIINSGAASAGNPRQVDKIELSGLEKGGKNRYKDILPFEHARVKLAGKDTGSCDYVNASHIKASRSHKRYIASQAPLPATFEDFWSVIWDQDVRVVVMLTAESEGGQLKCHPYWKEKEYGPIRLKSLSEKKVSLDIDKHRSDSAVMPDMQSSGAIGTGNPASASPNPYSFSTSSAEIGRRRANTTTTLEGSAPTPAKPPPGSKSSNASSGETPFVIIRKFALSHTAHPFAPIREITHLHYPSWPDFGAPAQPSHLLALVELANIMQHAALPVDVSSTLASASPSKLSSSFQDVSMSSPTNKQHQQHQTGSRPSQMNSGASRRRGGDAMSLSWHDAPEANTNIRPMLVHCSAGCGRTGTFCTVDSVIDMLKRQRLRALRRANRILEKREQRIAQQMNEKVQREQDTDGDIAMGEGSFAADSMAADEDCLSPLASFRDPSPFVFNSLDSTSRKLSDARSPLSQTATFGALPTPMEIQAEEKEDDYRDEDEEEDIDVSWLNGDNAELVDLIARTVEDFRCQRLSMVQSLRQFVLCYESIIEWVWRLQERAGSAAAAGVGGSAVGGHARSSSLQIGR